MDCELEQQQITARQKPLTKRQKEVLDILVRETGKTGQPPTVRELGEALGLSSPASVHRHLRVLEQKGYIDFRSSTLSGSLVAQDNELTRPSLTVFEDKVLHVVTAYTSERGFAPTVRAIVDRLEETSSIGKVYKAMQSLERKGYLLLAENQAHSIEVVPPAASTLYPVVVREVPSGARQFLSEDDPEIMWLPLPSLINSFKSSDVGHIFLVRVGDNSMSGAGIRNGDYVFVRKRQNAVNDAILVAEYAGKVVLRSYIARRNHVVHLEPANKNVERIEADADEVAVLGIEIGLFRRGSSSVHKRRDTSMQGGSL